MNCLRLLLLNGVLFLSGTLMAQLVTTVAGVLETPGFNDGVALSSRFFNPHGIAVDEEGNIYVADRYNHTIRVVSRDGQVSTLAGQAGLSGANDGQGASARFNEPWGLCVAADGIVYVADTKNNKIRSIMPDGTVRTIAGTGNFGSTDAVGLAATFGSPTGIEVDAVGNIYVADHLTHIIRRINPQGQVSTIAGLPYIPGKLDGVGRAAQFWRPYGLTLDRNGDILVADEWNHMIRRVTPTGEVTTVAGTGDEGLIDGPGATAAFNFPWDMTVDNQNNIYVADGFNYVIRKITPDGTVSSYAGNPLTSGGVDGVGANAEFSGATSIAWSALTGSLFVGDAYNHLIREITTESIPSLNLLNITGKEQICQGQNFRVQASTNIFPNYAFYVDDVLNQNSESAIYSTTNLSPGTHEIRVESFWEGTTVMSNVVMVEVIESFVPTISVVGELTFYEGDSTILVANGSGDFLWSNGATSQTITIKESGTYSVEVSSGNGDCPGVSEPLVITVLTEPEPAMILLEGGNVLCPGGTTTLVSNYETGNQWLRDGWMIAEATANFLEVTEPGFYQVQAEDPVTGVLVFSETVEIVEGEKPVVEIIVSDRNIQPEKVVEFSIEGEAMQTYLWDFGDPNSGVANSSTEPNPTHQYDEPGKYTVTLIVENEAGCTDTLMRSEYIAVFAETDLFIPTAFTPNDDGINDIFLVRGKILKSFNIKIFNQWGGLLYAGNDQLQGWDGRHKGQLVNAGTYTYVIAWSLDGKTQYTSGHITLLD